MAIVSGAAIQNLRIDALLEIVKYILCEKHSSLEGNKFNTIAVLCITLEEMRIGF